MSNRLTNDMRDTVVSALIKHRFGEEIANLCDRYCILAHEVWAEVFKRDMSKMMALPDGWLPTDDHFNVQFGASYTGLCFNGDFWANHYAPRRNTGNISSQLFKAPTAVSKRFTANKKGGVIAKYDANHKFSERFDALENAKKDLNETIGKVRDNTISAVRQFTTVDKLIEAWPEIEPFTKDITAKPKPQLPAVPIMDLNKMLDLPVDGAE